MVVTQLHCDFLAWIQVCVLKSYNKIHIKQLIKVLFHLFLVKISKSFEISFLFKENKALNFLSQYCDTAAHENKLYM